MFGQVFFAVVCVNNIGFLVMVYSRDSSIRFTGQGLVGRSGQGHRKAAQKEEGAYFHHRSNEV